MKADVILMKKKRTFYKFFGRSQSAICGGILRFCDIWRRFVILSDTMEDLLRIRIDIFGNYHNRVLVRWLKTILISRQLSVIYLTYHTYVSYDLWITNCDIKHSTINYKWHSINYNLFYIVSNCLIMCYQYIIVSWESCVTLRVPLQTIIERFMLHTVCNRRYAA